MYVDTTQNCNSWRIVNPDLSCTHENAHHERHKYSEQNAATSMRVCLDASVSMLGQASFREFHSDQVSQQWQIHNLGCDGPPQ